MRDAMPDLYSFEVPDAEFTVCDVETTGLHPQRARLTEIALVKVRGGAIVDRYHTLINPQQFIPREITELTGITNEMVYAAPKAREVMPRVRAFIGESIFVAHNVRFDRSFVDATLSREGEPPLDSPNLCTCRLARRLYPKLKSKSLGSLARHLGIRVKARHRAAGDADATAELLLHFCSLLEEEFDVTTVSDLLSFQNKPVYRVASPPRNVLQLKETVQQLPPTPGVYSFYNAKGEVIYIGKAKSLRDRVSSYFYHNVGHTRKVEEMVRNIRSLSHETTETELSALLLEAQQIKRHKPRFNSSLKRDRRFPFIRLDVQNPFPKIGWVYDMADDDALYFGPFSSRFAVEGAIETINKLFLLRECDGDSMPSRRQSACLYLDIKRCSAPCLPEAVPEEYHEEVRRVEQFLLGRHDELIAGLERSMESRAESLQFEEAAALRDRIQSLRRIIRQQEVMQFPVRHRHVIVLTPARRSFIEVHCLRAGLLARQFLIDQKEIDRARLKREVSDIYFSGQNELFESGTHDSLEMRIIASWCLTHRDESIMLPVEDDASLSQVLTRLAAEIRSLGVPKRDHEEKKSVRVAV